MTVTIAARPLDAISSTPAPALETTRPPSTVTR
jgi:hypothetical protein